MTISHFAARLFPAVAAALSAAAVAAWAQWMRARHCAPVADVFAAGYRAGIEGQAGD